MGMVFLYVQAHALRANQGVTIICLSLANNNTAVLEYQTVVSVVLFPASHNFLYTRLPSPQGKGDW